jgi:hypothetical protein
MCADDEVGEAVAIDISGPAYGDTAEIDSCLAADLEAVAAVERREIEVGGEP